jgi:hypothetical protein
MGEYQHIMQLAAVKNSSPPMNTYLKTSYYINLNGYDINSIYVVGSVAR